MSISKIDQEISVIAQVNLLSADMQLIYLQLISAIEMAISEWEEEGARSDHISTQLIEFLVNSLLQQPLSQPELVALLKKEISQQLT